MRPGKREAGEWRPVPLAPPAGPIPAGLPGWCSRLWIGKGIGTLPPPKGPPRSWRRRTGSRDCLLPSPAAPLPHCLPGSNCVSPESPASSSGKAAGSRPRCAAPGQDSCSSCIPHGFHWLLNCIPPGAGKTRQSGNPPGFPGCPGRYSCRSRPRFPSIGR